MKTNDLISKLSKDLKSVRPIISIKKNMLITLSIIIISIFSYVFIKSNYLNFIHIPEFIYEDFIIFVLMIIGLFLLLKESTPGYIIKRKYYYLPIGIIGIWLLSLFIRFFIQEETYKQLDYIYHDCITDTVFMSIASIFTIVFIVNRRIPFRKELIGFWIFLICSSGSALGVSILCPDENSSHIFVFHFIPVLTMSLLGIFLGKFIFKDLI